VSTVKTVDVAIVGAGPAGTTAALRLLQLGYRVLLCERERLPRAQVGEALTPGVAHSLDLIDARDAVARVPQRAALPAVRLWHAPEIERTDATAHTMVDRSRFDALLFRLAQERGAHCHSGTLTRWARCADGTWDVQVESESDQLRYVARQVLDARGRNGARGIRPTAPRLLASWMDLEDEPGVAEVRLEATADCWLWGATLAGGGYRLMVFCDPSNRQLHSDGRERWFRHRFHAARLFAEFAPALERRRPLHSCAATPYVAREFWKEGVLKVGDAAFALDPLSSTGVEKAMRFSLQAALALNTLLSEPREADVAREFLADRIDEAVADHAAWSAQAYADAWPNGGTAFWRARAAGAPAAAAHATSARTDEAATASASTRVQSDAEFLRATLPGSMRLSPQIAFVELPCAVGDRIRRHPAVSHPQLARPAAFVGGVALQPLLASMTAAADLRQWLQACALQASPSATLRTAAWAARHGLVVGAGDMAAA
jgi:flavin-dependent dehydrogenase